jgi:hypothetical protein
MREIIHIQAGSLSNYTGTHYWNTQENYFVYDEDGTSITDYSISFKEGRDNVRPVDLQRSVLVHHPRLIHRTSLPCVQGSLLSIRNVRVFLAKGIQALAHTPWLHKANFGTLTRDSHQEEALTWPITW